jgi:hypothetical protein
MKNILLLWIAISFFTLLVLLLIFSSIVDTSTGIESFNGGSTGTRWSKDLIRRFNIYQSTMNNNANQFNLDVLQNQATPDEAEILMATGYWPWPDDLKYEYLSKVASSPIVNIQPQYALNYAMKLYNQRAVQELMAWNTKEGQFLLYGANIGYTDGNLPSFKSKDPGILPYMNNMNNSIQCSTYNTTGRSILTKKVFNSINNMDNQNIDMSESRWMTKETPVNPSDLPSELTGFQFIKDPCDPCVVLNSTPDYSCPFSINVDGDTSVSKPWQKLWNL